MEQRQRAPNDFTKRIEIMSNVLGDKWEKAFRDADIRGEYPIEINEELSFRVARSFVQIFKLTTILVGRDVRLSSPSLFDSFVNLFYVLF